MAYQSKLPHLPIPPLKDTMERYLRALEGLQVSSPSSPSGVRCGALFLPGLALVLRTGDSRGLDWSGREECTGAGHGQRNISGAQVTRRSRGRPSCPRL